jgi:hypothetical protein
MADFLVSIVTARRMRSCMPRRRSLHLPEKKKKMAAVFLKRCLFYAPEEQKTKWRISCEYCNCQAHAQLYAAPQVPPPAGEKEKKCRLSFSNKTRQQNGGFSCEYCNCQAHAQLYAALQVPPPGKKNKKMSIVFLKRCF